jgi:hypothetical protein
VKNRPTKYRTANKKKGKRVERFQILPKIKNKRNVLDVTG